jgi:hypothetical protein
MVRERYPSKEALDRDNRAEDGLSESFAQLDEFLVGVKK